MSSHGPQNRAFSVTHQRAILDIKLDGTINAITEITILPLSADLNTVHLHSSHCTISSIYHPSQHPNNTHQHKQPLHFILNQPNLVRIPDPNSVRQFPEAKRRLFEQVNEKETGELAIQIDRHKINRTSNRQSATSLLPPSDQHQLSAQKDKDLEFDPIIITIEYQITQADLTLNPAICVVGGQHPHLFTNSISARSWVPCLDSLWERSPWELEFIVPRSSITNHAKPSPLTVVASGELIEQIIHPTDPSKTVFYYAQAIPTSVQHIAWVVGPLTVNDLTPYRPPPPSSPHQDKADQPVDQKIITDQHHQSSTEINLLAFCLPNRQSQLLHVVNFLPHALSFFTQEYGSYPYSSYKLVFLDMSAATHSICATFNSATLTLCPSDLLYPPQVIDQVYETKPVLVQSLASQWIGINIIPKSPSDTWLINGLSLYITGLYFKVIWGTNDYRYRIKQEIMKCVEMDVDKPPICHLDCFIDRHRSLGLCQPQSKSRTLHPRSTSQAIGRWHISRLDFLRICRKLNGNELKSWADQWIYASGCPIFQVTAYFNRKKLTHELTLRQLNRSKQYYEDDQTSWAEKCNLKPVDRFEGQMSIRIQESDGIPYEHVLDIKEPFKRYELPSNHKNKKFKRSSRRYASSNQAPDLTETSTETFTYPPWERSQEERDRWKVEDWTEEEDLFITQSNVEWIRLDVEVEWICEFRFEMKEFMWLEQLQRDRDVVAQLEAVRALKTLPSKVVSSHLCRVVLISEYFFRIRIEAILALVSCATSRCGFLGLFHLLKIFQSRFCYPPQVEPDSPWHIRAIPKPNQFDNFADYFIRKALVVALSHVRDQNNNSPSVCHQFFLDQLVYNDNSLNPYSDAHYIATTIGSMTDSLIHLADNAGREQLVEIFGTKALSTGTNGDLEKTCDKRLLLMINELERCFMADRLVPSYRNLIAMAVIEAKLKLMFAGLLPVDLVFFLLCARPGNYLPLRILAFDCLLLLRGFQEKAIIRYMFMVLRDDSSLLVRRRLAMGLVQCLPILVLIEELGMEPSDQNFSVIDESHPLNTQKFDHKTVTKHLRAEVGRALILRECIMSVMLHPTVDTDVQTCLLKISEVLFKPSDESVPVRIPEEKQPPVEAPVPVATKIRIHAPSVPPIEPSQSPAPLPKIILKDHQQHLANDTDPGGSSPPRLPPPDVPSKLAAALIRKPKPPPKPKKFQASGMTIPDHKMCQNLLKKLASNPLSQPFRKPVDPIRESAPNYFNIISNPMDFKTMGLKLEMGQYPNREAFKDDVNLIFKNCKTYNLPDSSLVVKYAEPLKATFDKLWERSEKTMSAIQAKGLGGVNPGRLQPTDAKSIVAPSNVVPLAPPPSFAAFAAGGSMIPPVSSSPISPGLPPPPPVPSRMSPEASRPGRLKVKLKPRTSISTGSTTSEILPENNSSIPPAPKSGLKIKFTTTATNSTLANPPSTPTTVKPEGGVCMSSTYPSIPFPASSSSTYPPPPPPIISMAPPKSRPPPTPSFVPPPPPPPPTFESFSLAAQLGPKPTPAPTRTEKPSVEVETSDPFPNLLEKPTKSKKRPSSSQPTSIAAPPPPPGSSSSQKPVKRNNLIVQFPKPPALPPPSAPAVITPSSAPGPTIGLPNFPAPPPPSLPKLDLKSSKHPTPPTSSIPPAKSTVNPPLSSNPIKIKVVQRPAPRPVVQDRPESSVPSDVANFLQTIKQSWRRVQNQRKIDGYQECDCFLLKHIWNVSHPIQLTPLSRGSTSTSTSAVSHWSGSRKTKKVDLYRSTSSKAQDIGLLHLSPSTSTAAGKSVTLAPPPSSSVVSEPVKAASPVADDLLNPKKAKVIIRKMMEHPQGVWFRIPVDPIAVGAPTYLDEIKNPMDLSTMLKKLDKGTYKRHSELMADFELIVSNCVQFNGAESQLGLEAKALKKVWDLEWEKAAKMSYTDKRSLLGLFNKLNQVPGVELFNEPVDPVKYQIPTYFAVIGGQQNARDLGTIKANLVADRYNSIGEFEADVRLMLKNCFTFNAPTTPVEVIGRDLEKAFDLAMVKVRKDAGLPPPAGSANAGNKRKGAEPAASSKRSRVG
ncbi:uncharacterized protein PGTG_03382 [Puccinia graminis f. sp. tritici CRL 75-36-700-3]|uniref:Transcription initiation factor TFIID subunit 2 n=1 Tax=Puccinia graminis f. sp. tritici (strain CRL 75-36-700-3 / race SCCL) TaxID=418459 RepID=E3JZF1_PUCGT|nr:uncharacterized protein PGTG_03382 [Puccinia graminis f. sp. tritici CRL 75-36-700-3]EFP77426.2 hypothetical protein PGTG_03382 [Puccinia graminis f. sp. tritici CRL 75-36-700-3]